MKMRSGHPPVNVRVTDLRITGWLFFSLSGLLVFMAFSCSGSGSEENLRRYLLAGEMYAQGRFAETAGLLEGIRDFPPSLILRTKAEYFSGDIDKAEKSCREALKQRPSAFEARLYLARILREQGNQEEAKRHIESLLADNPLDIRALRLAAAFALESGKGDEAAALLDRAAESSAECAMALLDRARLRWVAGRGPEALEDLARARAMLPWDTPFLRSIEHLESSIKELM